VQWKRTIILRFRRVAFYTSIAALAAPVHIASIFLYDSELLCCSNTEPALQQRK
jgi:hypothetical protein